MFGQGNHAPQFGQGRPAPPPPPYQQAPSPVPAPPFQPAAYQQVPPNTGVPPFQQAPSQGLPPPPTIQQGQPTTVAQRPPSAPPPPQYQHGPPAPPQQPIPLPGMLNTGQPYLPPPPNYQNAPMIRSRPLQAQARPPYPPLMTNQNFHNVIPPIPPPHRGLPPLQGQGLYRNPPPPPPGIQHVPTPPPPAPVTPAQFDAFGHGTAVDALPPSLPPPPPPPLPSSPPPLSSSPPPANSGEHLQDADPEVQSMDNEVSRGSRDSHINAAFGTDLLTTKISVDGVSVDEAGDVGNICSALGGEGPVNLPSPIGPTKTLKGALTSQSPVDKTAAFTAGDSDMDMEDDNEYSFSEDVSPPASPVATKCTVEYDVQASARKTIADAIPAKVPSPVLGNENEGGAKVFVKDVSPFRHIQGYASDDSSEDDKRGFISDVSPARVSPKAVIATSASHEEEVLELYSNIGSKNSSETRSQLRSKSNQNNVSSMPMETINPYNSSPSLHKVSSTVVSTSPLHETKRIGDSAGHHQDDKKFTATKEGLDVSHRRDITESCYSEVDQQVGPFQREADRKQDSTVLKVDEFGRMIQEGRGDSDSDGRQPKERRARRGMSRSRSRSPQEGRWRRRSRSPRRRKERRSRSHSGSPKRRRSRSKSPPASRYTSEFARRERGEPPQCFNFLRGRCHRGASCRFVHNESGRHRSRPQQPRSIPHDSEKYDVRSRLPEGNHGFKEIEKEKVVEQYGNISQEVGRGQDFQSGQDFSVCSKPDVKDENPDNNTTIDSVCYNVQPLVSSLSGQSHSIEVVGQDNASQELRAHVRKEQVWLSGVAQNHVKLEGNAGLQSEDHQSLPDESLKNQPALPEVLSFSGNSDYPKSRKAPLCQTSQASLTTSIPLSESQNPAPQYQQPEGISLSLQTLQSEALLGQVSAAKSHPGETSVTQAHLDQSHTDQIPPNESFPQHMHGSESQTSSFPAPGPLLQPSQQTLPQPPYFGETIRPVIPQTDFHASHFPQNVVPLGQSEMRPALHEDPNHPWVVGTRPEPHHLHMNDFSRRPHMGNQQVQAYGGTVFTGVEQSSHPPVATDHPFPYGPSRDHHLGPHPIREEVHAPFQQQIFTSSSFTQGDTKPAQPFFSREPFGKQMHTLPGDNMTSRPFFREDFQTPARNLPYPQLPSHSLQHPAGANFPSNIGAPSTIDSPFMRHPLSFTEINVQSQLADPGIPKISNTIHYNPFASTFERGPIVSNSNAFGRENMDHTSKYGSSFTSQHTFMNNHGPGTLPVAPSGEFPYQYPRESSAEVTASSQKQHGKEVPAGDQYDPLFDSIEASSNISKQFDHAPDKNPARDVGVGATDLENDEFGETATDAEVGAVEDGSPLPNDVKEWSPGIPVELDNQMAGEGEIDRVPSQGKSKKSKDSRAMKLFRIAVANFVKEVLKPSWRQGNMSKEAFKTIVKKTVDKVSSTMPSHSVPKSQAKINQYVESSQRKLTKLVMGYVDKYVKV